MNMGRVWEDQFRVTKTKYVKALKSHFIIIQRNALDREGQFTENRTKKNGLYYVKIDFDELESERLELPEYIESHMKPVFEYTLQQFTALRHWDAKGNDHILSISFALEKDPANYATKLMALTSPSGEFVVCNEIDNTAQVLSIDLILPFEDKERAYVLYGTANGLDGGGRH